MSWSLSSSVSFLFPLINYSNTRIVCHSFQLVLREQIFNLEPLNVTFVRHKFTKQYIYESEYSNIGKQSELNNNLIAG